MSPQLQGRSFYLPHNLDFRGRAYTIAPYLTHIGDDLSRGLLTFAEKKPLGKSGLRWLKIHLANVYGNDKCVSSCLYVCACVCVCVFLSVLSV